MEIALNTGDKIWAAKINTFTQTNSNALYRYVNYITVVMNLTLRRFTFSIQMHTKTGDERISQDQIYLIFPLDHHRALLQQETDEGDMKK